VLVFYTNKDEKVKSDLHKSYEKIQENN